MSKRTQAAQQAAKPLDAELARLFFEGFSLDPQSWVSTRWQHVRSAPGQTELRADLAVRPADGGEPEYVVPARIILETPRPTSHRQA